MATQEYEKSIKPELNENLRIAFFNQYTLSEGVVNNDNKTIKLKPTHEMSYEDALTVAKIENYHRNINLDHNRYDLVRVTFYGLASRMIDKKIMISYFDSDKKMEEWFGVREHLSTHSYNYLISKGYALPFMGYDVGALYDKGWIIF